MSDKRYIQDMIDEFNIRNFETASNELVSYELPKDLEFPQLVPTRRTNQQLVRSILYMGYLIRKGKRDGEKQDIIVNGLEVITSVMDNLYFLTKFGIGKQSKLLQNLSHQASKVWFVSLLLTLNKLIKNIGRLISLKTKVLKEVRKCQLNLQNNQLLTTVLLEKYELKMIEIKHLIRSDIFELLTTLFDLSFVSIELFKIRINPKLERFLGFISAGISFYRMSHNR